MIDPDMWSLYLCKQNVEIRYPHYWHWLRPCMNHDIYVVSFSASWPWYTHSSLICNICGATSRLQRGRRWNRHVFQDFFLCIARSVEQGRLLNRTFVVFIRIQKLPSIYSLVQNIHADVCFEFTRIISAWSRGQTTGHVRGISWTCDKDGGGPAMSAYENSSHADKLISFRTFLEYSFLIGCICSYHYIGIWCSNHFLAKHNKCDFRTLTYFFW